VTDNAEYVDFATQFAVTPCEFESSTQAPV